jgi:HlyD family secretion protein
MNAQPEANRQDINVVLGLQARTRRFGLQFWLALAGAVAGAWVAYAWFVSTENNRQPRYQTEAAWRGELVVKVAATGNLQPTNQVDVGSELSGIIEKVYVQENDQVKRGEVLARLDVSKLEDAVAKSQANLVQAQAQVQQMQATVTEARANLGRLREVAELSGGKVPSKAELDTAEANLQRAVANVASAKAAVVQVRANLKSDETNLAKASIRSPINGVVLTRKVEPGQTVAASLQAPVLFTLAEDLSQMELHVNVDEADVGQVRPGQPADFHVAAWPNRSYPAQILRVDYGSQTTDQVVTYLTVLKVDNRDLSLRPGMTATAEITTATLKDVLLIPAAALRFAPPTGGTEKAGDDGGGLVSALLPRPPRPVSSRLPPARKKNGMQQIWVLRDGHPTPLEVKAGLTDGRLTEVLDGPLQPGMLVITDLLGAAAK